jgi:hypothetical protein
MGAEIKESEKSDSGSYILRRLPGWMPTDESTGNFKLLDTVGHAIDRLDADIESVDNATTPQEAETVAQLEELAKMVQLPSKQNEGKEKYRTRVLVEFQHVTNEGSIDELVSNVATLLDVRIQKIDFRKDGHGSITLAVPGSALDSLEITNSEFVNIAESLIAAGFNLSAIRRGTFTYITPTEYQNGNWDSSKGYDGLDTNGEPKDNGGTYAGLIE